jgi:hypothetical protein
MNRDFDEFSKSLAESCSRRESLRAVGALFAGAVLSRVPLASVWAKGPDPCKAFCKCRNKTQQNQCLSACRACGGNTSRLCGSCGSYACCGAGSSCCGGYCSNFADDFYNCGACGNVCQPPGAYEQGACIDGECEYVCASGAALCNGTCTPLDWDANNCGACGNICPASAPYCNQGTCDACPSGLTLCGGQCVDILYDSANCGGCGNVCPVGEVCYFASCCNPTIACCSADCDGSCTPDHPYYPNC